jgi:hypothetical protein
MINAYFTHEMLRKQFVDGIGELVPTRSAPICN